MPRQGHLEQVPQERVQMGLEHLQREIHDLSLGSLFHGPATLSVNKFFLTCR